MNDIASRYLKHHFLIAMPHMADRNFAQTLVYLVEHNEHGAMGLVVNRLGKLSLADALEQLRPDGTIDARCRQLPLHAGGPVHTERGFVLHPPGWHYQATVELDELALTTSQDVLLAIADGYGPERFLIALGYAGWEAGQLEAELFDNAWLTCPADPAVLFDVAVEQRLACATARLGIDLGRLSSQVGHA